MANRQFSSTVIASINRIPQTSAARHFEISAPISKQKYVPSSGTYPQGFKVSGTHIGVKKSNKSAPDLAFLTSESLCSAAAVFTKNRFQAAPVTYSRQVLKKRANGGIRSIIVNSGCANAVTGRGGMEDAEKMGAAADNCFGHSGDGQEGRTVVMSTGVIGQRYVTINKAH